MFYVKANKITDMSIFEVVRHPLFFLGACIATSGGAEFTLDRPLLSGHTAVVSMLLAWEFQRSLDANQIQQANKPLTDNSHREVPMAHGKTIYA
jgi:hypothetical protein